MHFDRPQRRAPEGLRHALAGLLLVIAAPWVPGAPSPVAQAQNLEPGSLLIFPVVRSEGAALSIVSVTNIDTSTATDVSYRYLEVVDNPVDPLTPLDCTLTTFTENLTPADTLTRTVECQYPAHTEGYLVVVAENPGSPGGPWSHNALVGNQFFVRDLGVLYSLIPLSFQSPQQPGNPTDNDTDGELDFDGFEYSAGPDRLYLDNFLASLGNKLILINLTGGTQFDVSVDVCIWNDNEIPLNGLLAFRCWFDERLDDLNVFFTLGFLLTSTMHDPTEWDVDCDGVGDLETGWARFNGLVAESSADAVPLPTILGAVAGNSVGLERGRPLWHTGSRVNGDFLKTSVDDPEFP